VTKSELATPAVTGSEEDADREAFEELVYVTFSAIYKMPKGEVFLREKGKQYQSSHVQAMWEAWQLSKKHYKEQAPK
jgi:hypothetical protein